MAEAAAVRIALELGIMNGWRKIFVESDSQLVMQDIQQSNARDFRWDSTTLVQDILALKQHFDDCGFVWIRRELNSVANYVARNILTGLYPTNWMANPEHRLVTMLNRDQ